MKRLLLLPFLMLFVLSCGKDDAPAAPNNPDPNTGTTDPIDPPADPVTTTTLLSVSGRQILDTNNTPILLKGVGFNNWHWIEDPLPPTTHHSEIDFTRVSDMGMNAVRFAMNYWIFEDDANPYTYKQTGWDWIDTNIEWAKNNDVYLILNMHTPQGGYQSQGTGDALWDEADSQNRLIALWKAIAEKYKDEPQIAGFGIVNEPIPNRSIGQWSDLAQRIIDEIRSVDNHIIFAEQAISVKGVAEPDPELNFPRITGDNIVYEFHTYEPFQFTHQLLAFANVGEGGVYPDDDLIELGDAAWHTAIFNNPTLAENSDWQYLEGVRYTIEDTDIRIGVPVLITGNIGANGRANFDDIILNEYDENGVFVQAIHEENLNTTSGWEFWSRNDDGEGGIDNNSGRTDTSSFYIEGATDESNLNNRLAAFEPIQGYSYELSGWVRTQDLAATGDALLRIDFYTTAGDVNRRNKTYLESILDRVDSWATGKNAPVYVGEVGTGGPSFENGKGGLVFAEDMITLIQEKNIHFTYFDYHSDNFGMYLGDTYQLPDPSNTRQPLIDLFNDILQ